MSVTETYTSNANLAPSGQEQSSFITTLGANLGVSGNGARVQLNGNIGVQGLLYLGEYNRGSSDFSADTVFVNANLLGSVEAIEKFFYIEGAANVSQSCLSPFAPTPAGNIGATDNRYTSVGFRISPLLLAAREVSYFALLKPRQVDLFQQSGYAHGNSSSREVPHLQTKRHVVENVQVRKKPVVLKDQPEVA